MPICNHCVNQKCMTNQSLVAQKKIKLLADGIFPFVMLEVSCVLNIVEFSVFSYLKETEQQASGELGKFCPFWLLYLRKNLVT